MKTTNGFSTGGAIFVRESLDEVERLWLEALQ